MEKTHQKEVLCRNIFDAVRVNSLPAVKACLVFGGTVDMKDSMGWTPLHHAAWYNHGEIFSYLLSQGAEISALTRAGETPYNLAFRNGAEGILSFLFEMAKVA